MTRKANIILVTLDTTRADRMGFLGSQRGLTPNLDGLAAKSVVFTHAYSQVPLTTSSHATILSGTYPQFHKVDYPGVALPVDLPYAPEILHKLGYRTAAFVGSTMMDPKGSAPGFDRGFQEYDAGFHLKNPDEDRYRSVERRGAEVVGHALAWIRKNTGAPFFVWIHLYDPHAPYDPPEPFARRFRSEPYDGEIAYVDSVVGTLLAQLHAARLYDESLIAVMADHGEALGEHGERGHGIFLYDPTIRVPLLFKMPAQRAAGQRIDDRVELVDVLPTMLEVAGAAKSKAMQGHSLIALINRRAETEDRPAYSETDYPRRAYGWSSLRALRTGKYLFVEAPRQELYDETSDTAAERNLASTSPAVSGTLAEQLTKFREQTRSLAPSPETNLDPEQQAKLHALGYVGLRASKIGPKAGGADPKDKISLANDITDANLWIEDGRYQEAIAKLEEVVAKDPTIVDAYDALGGAWIRLGKYQNALPALRKSAELQPDYAWAHYQLGLALEKTNDLHAAAPELEAAMAGSPLSAEVRFLLASVYARTNRVEEAKKLLQKALELKPKYFEADLLLGFIFVMQKDPASALGCLQQAIDLNPNSSKAHQYMAEAYAELGDQQTASRERALATQLRQQESH
ncbi:MAG: sulfatase-like hydrolase/transferase [Acidobacteriia bacterium]|nr:sulfatase-like hydrolase/transferase [Terriglobia bacterium]